MSPDTARVVAYLREHPGSSRYEMTLGLHGVHVTARMSDARKHGYVFASWRDDTGVMQFRVREPGQQELGLTG